MKKITLLSVILVLALLAVTGTVSANGKRTFTAHLTAEAPNVDTQAVGQAIFRVSKDGESVYYKIIVAQLTDITMAHIHWQPGGGDAPPVVWLLPSGPPPTLVPGTTNGILIEGTFTSADFVGNLAGQPMSALVEIFRAGESYVNVHTVVYPGGEIRGDID
jgi:ABC-type uncharacterized transport system permease subunit